MSESNSGKMLFDWHTHTRYSHGKGSIEENVMRARELGLESIAITDHGPGHFGYGFRRKDIKKMREEIDEMNRKYSDIKVYMSVEANIINSSGVLDVKPEEFKYYDFVIAGYHFGTLGENPASSLLLHSRNLIGKKTGYSESLEELNTEMVVNSLKKNRITTLTHPGDKAKVDLDAVFKACEETGTYLEISDRHRQLTVDEIKKAAQYDVKFILGSDAHIPEKVGSCVNSMKRVYAAGLDSSRIVNFGV